MEKPPTHRIYRPLTVEERERWTKARDLAEQERPAVLAQVAKLYEAARKAGISSDQVRQFLMGKNPAVWDRLGDTARLDGPLKFYVPKPGDTPPQLLGASPTIAPPPTNSAPSTPAEI